MRIAPALMGFVMGTRTAPLRKSLQTDLLLPFPAGLSLAVTNSSAASLPGATRWS